MKKLLILLIFLTGCSGKDIDIKEFPSDSKNPDTCLAAPIVDTNRILKPFLVVDTDEQRIAFKIPNTPVEVDLQRKERHEFYSLAQKMSQDNIAMNNALLAIVLMRNMAPCDAKNIELSWKTMQLFIRSVKDVYDEER